MERLAPLERDYYAVDEEGSDRNDSSSDEEGEVDWLARSNADGTALSVAGRTIVRRASVGSQKDNDFEADCEMELDAALEEHNKGWMATTCGIGDLPGTSEEKDGKTPATKSRTQDGNNSDEEFAKAEGMTQPSYDQLLYDPDIDEENQNWIDKHRRSYLPQKMMKSKALPNSDAVLNCPGCMTVLCLDCQRHELYKTQYRAMFVMNCTIRAEEAVHCPVSKRRGGVKSRKRKASQNEDNNDVTMEDAELGEESNTDRSKLSRVLPDDANINDVFHPVACNICKTEVAMYDSDEIYHLFNVLSSHC